MKFWLTCKECGEEVKHDFGSGKAAQARYERQKDDFVCDECREKARQAAYEAKQQADTDSKLAAGWQWESVHYSDWKNTYQGMEDDDGNEIKKGEYHADTKHIDILVPPSLVAKHFSEDAAEAEEVSEPAPEWQTMEIEESHVLYNNGRSVKIAMPGRSDYDGYVFWHPVKCFREVVPGVYSISFTSNWTFKLQANGGALTKELTASEMSEYARELGRWESHSDLYQPQKLDVIDNPQAIEELVDND